MFFWVVFFACEFCFFAYCYCLGFLFICLVFVIFFLFLVFKIVFIFFILFKSCFFFTELRPAASRLRIASMLVVLSGSVVCFALAYFSLPWLASSWTPFPCILFRSVKATLFVFFTTATGTWFVTPYFGRIPHNGPWYFFSSFSYIRPELVNFYDGRCYFGNGLLMFLQ